VRSRKRWLIPGGIAFVLIAAVVSAFFYIRFLLYTPPQPPEQGEEQEFEILKGETLDSIAKRLFQEGLLRDPAALKLAVFFGGGAAGIKAGTHHLRTDQNAWEIYEAIQVSPVARYIRIVLPEGLDSFEIAGRLETAGICSAEEFLAAARSVVQIADIAPGAESLEGYLFPDTYHVPVGASATDVINMMLRRFRVEADNELREKFKEVGLSLNEGVILASLIAKEAGNPDEMPLISSVFHNRLRIGMKLDCDATFIYARKLAGDWDGVVRIADRQFESPYNTYLHGGLPPAPIGNPGSDALFAAASPAESDYLYFVAKGPDTADGHRFSKTMREHLQAVREYQQRLRDWRKAQR